MPPPGPSTRLVYLRLASDYEMLEQVRVFLSAYCQHRFTTGVAEQIGLAANELLENAIRFGRVAQGLELELNTDRQERRVWITVVNHAVPSRIQILREWVDRLSREPGEESLKGLIKRLNSESGPPVHLGLSRLRHEARMTIELEENGARVAVTAISELQPPKTQFPPKI